MKRTIALGAVLALLLSGCAEQEVAWETVSDDPALQAGSILPEPYEILVALPSDAEQTMETGVYANAAEEYEVVTQVLPASTVQTAIRQISGFDAEDLEVVKLQFGSLPEYQFAWANETEEGTVYSRALLVASDSYYYVLQFHAHGRSRAAEQRDVFASFGLFCDEGV